MDRKTPPETRARRWFVRGSGVLFIGVLQLLMIQMVILYLDARLIHRGAAPIDQVGDMIAHAGFFWWLFPAMIQLSRTAWDAFCKPWPRCADRVPGMLATSAVILTWALLWIHLNWLPANLNDDDSTFAQLILLLGLPIGSTIVAYYSTRRWLLGPKLKVAHPRPYAANSAYKSSDGKPLWGYRVVFLTLGWGLMLLCMANILENAFKASVLAVLGIACFCQWRDLQHERFTPAVWYRGLVLMLVLIGTAYFNAGTSFGHMAAVFFGFCIANWIAATARDLFFRKSVRAALEGV